MKLVIPPSLYGQSVIAHGLVTLREARSQSHGLKPQLQAQAVEGKSIQILFKGE